MKRITRTIAAVLNSRRFVVGVLFFFIFESLWIAGSAAYPMAFDEDFHFGLIKIYSHYWLPFLSSQPKGTSQFGAITRDPSYLYHYIMSFPYRFIELFTHDQTIQILILRGINIALFGLGLLLFYKVLQRAGSSRLLSSTGLALFVLIPIVPMLAGQINYDNLLFPLTAWTCLLVYRLNERLRDGELDLKTLVTLLAVCLLASLVKYAFLPIAFVVVLFVGIQIWRAFYGDGKVFRSSLLKGYRAVSRRTKLALLVVLVVSAGMFVQRYGLNTVTYHTPLPKCDAVLNADECMSYGPWARNYQDKQTKGDIVDGDGLTYTWTWLQAMHYRLFFAVNGPASGYTNYPPVPLPSAAAIILTVMGVLALLLYWRRVFVGHSFLLFLLLFSVVYCVVLWGNDYNEFSETGQPVAINGRYLLVVLLPLLAVFGQAYSSALRLWPVLRIWIAGIIVVLFLQGGGVFSFILRSDVNWDWPSTPVVRVNNAARDILRPFIIEGNKYY
jgi:hypothetical protein